MVDDILVLVMAFIKALMAGILGKIWDLKSRNIFPRSLCIPTIQMSFGAGLGHMLSQIEKAPMDFDSGPCLYEYLAIVANIYGKHLNQDSGI